MNSIIEGTLKRYEDMSYTASVAFGLAFVDLMKENSDSEAELRINLNGVVNHLTGAVETSMAHFVLNETYADLVTESEKIYRSGLNVGFANIDFNPVVLQKHFIPTDKIVYISDKPLFSPSSPPQGGSLSGGTYVLVNYADLGLVLYWTSQAFAAVMDRLSDGKFATSA